MDSNNVVYIQNGILPYLNKNKIIKLASKLMRLEKAIYIGSEEKVPYVLSDVVILILIICCVSLTRNICGIKQAGNSLP